MTENQPKVTKFYKNSSFLTFLTKVSDTVITDSYITSIHLLHFTSNVDTN